MDNTDRLFDPAEDELIRHGFENGYTDKETVKLLARHGFTRTYMSIYGRRRLLGYRHTEFLNKHAPEVKEVRQQSDHKFKVAMLAAIRSGAETAVLGVVKDRRRFALTSIRPEPAGSCMGSPAAACSD